MAWTPINERNWGQTGLAGTVGSGSTDWGFGGNIFNSDNAQLALGGLQGLSALLGAFGGMNQNKMLKKQLGLARDQFNFQKDITNRNYANQLQAFNTALEDRINARASQEDRPEGYVEDYLNKHRLQG